jgi:hypothetical protein
MTVLERYKLISSLLRNINSAYFFGKLGKLVHYLLFGPSFWTRIGVEDVEKLSVFRTDLEDNNDIEEDLKRFHLNIVSK